MIKKWSGGMMGSSRQRKLDRAENLIDQGDWDGACELLEAYTRHYPRDLDGWGLLAEVYENLHEPVKVWDAVIEHSLKLAPHMPEVWYNAMGAAMNTGNPFSAHHYAAYFLNRWPDHELASKVKSTYPMLEKACREILAGDSVQPGSTPEELMAFEQLTVLMSLGQFSRVRQLCLDLIRRLPHNPTPHNNLALAALVSGNTGEAYKHARIVLEEYPGNIHALCNLIQTCVMTGQTVEAQAAAEQLKQAIRPASKSLWGKAMEGLAYLGDHAAILELFKSQRKAIIDAAQYPELVYHFAAVAASRLGDDKQARRWWREALKISPEFMPANENLADLDLPVGERNGAWYFSFNHWLQKSWVEEIQRIVEKVGDDEEYLYRKMRQYLDKRPAFLSVIPILLERGDPMGRQTALMIASYARLPVLTEFAVSAHGTDENRMDAALAAKRAGLLPRGQAVPMLIRGEHTENRLMEYKINYGSPNDLPSERIQEISQAAFDAMHKMDYPEVERLARKGLEMKSDYPAFLNYLWTALRLQGRQDESGEVLRHALERHPDYTFARCDTAIIYAQQGKLDEAKALVDPLEERAEFHISEFRILCVAQFEIALAEGLFDAAESRLDMWENVDPDNPNPPHLRMKLLLARAPFLNKKKPKRPA